MSYDQLTANIISEIKAKDAEIELLRAEVAALRKFAGKVLAAHRDDFTDVAGDDVQEWATAVGLLAEVEITEWCGEDCRCAEYYDDADLPAKCLRLTDAGMAAIDAARAKE